MERVPRSSRARLQLAASKGVDGAAYIAGLARAHCRRPTPALPSPRNGRSLPAKAGSRSELNDQSPSRTASLEPAMGVGRPFRRIDIRHAKRNFAGLDKLAQPIELLPLLRVGAHPGRREADSPLRDALKPADGSKGAAVANGGDDKRVEHRSIREAIDSLREVFANPRRDVIASANDDVGAKRGDQFFVLLGSIGDDRQPLGFGELDDVA